MKEEGKESKGSGRLWTKEKGDEGETDVNEMKGKVVDSGGKENRKGME